MVAAVGHLPDLSKGLWYFEDVQRLTKSPARPKGITRKTFDNWSERGDLVAYRMGGFVVTTPDDFARFLVRVDVIDESEEAAAARRENEEADREQAAVLAELDGD